MSSVLAELDSEIVLNNWLDKAGQMIQHLDATNLRDLPVQELDRLIDDLGTLLESGDTTTGSSEKALCLAPTLFYHLGVLNAVQGDWDTASHHFEEAAYLSEECVLRLKDKNPEDSRLFQRFLTFLREQNLPYTQARATLHLGEDHLESGAWQEGLNELQKALKLFQGTENIEGKAHASLAIGDVHRNFGDYEIAQSYYWDAVRFFRKAGNKPGEVAAELRYGIALIDLQNYKDAGSHILSARNKLTEVGDVDQLAVAERWLNLVAQMKQTAGEKI